MPRFHAAVALVSTGVLTLTAAPAWAAHQPSATQTSICRTSALALAWTSGGTAKPGGTNTEEQVTAVVSVHNTGSRTCILRGHPKVTLEMGTETEGVRTETFSRQSSHKPRTVTLKPGGTARFTLYFLAGKRSDNIIDPGVAVITPPRTPRPSSCAGPGAWFKYRKQPRIPSTTSALSSVDL
jgi:hypothetical protein